MAMRGSCLGSFVQIFFSHLDVFGDGPHRDQHVPAEVTRSMAGCASDWRRSIKSCSSSGTDRKAIGLLLGGLAENTGWIEMV